MLSNLITKIVEDPLCYIIIPLLSVLIYTASEDLFK